MDIRKFLVNTIILGGILISSACSLFQNQGSMAPIEKLSTALGHDFIVHDHTQPISLSISFPDDKAGAWDNRLFELSVFSKKGSGLTKLKFLNDDCDLKASYSVDYYSPTDIVMEYYDNTLTLSDRMLVEVKRVNSSEVQKDILVNLYQRKGAYIYQISVNGVQHFIRSQSKIHRIKFTGKHGLNVSILE